MNKILKFEVSIVFSDDIVDNEDIMNVAENIARAIKSEANHGEGIAPENTDAFTKIVEVRPENLDNVILKIY